MKKLLCLMFALVGSFCSCAMDTGGAECPEDFSFSLTWGAYGCSSYDADSGVLVKSKFEPETEKYSANLTLDADMRTAAWNVVRGLDWSVYGETYDPHMGLASAPGMDLILRVTANGVTHEVSCLGILLSYETHDADGQKFLDACRALEDLLVNTPEWQAMPEYTVLFE